jgi:tetratricopeptide (TPR) repeat protein
VLIIYAAFAFLQLVQRLYARSPSSLVGLALLCVTTGVVVARTKDRIKEGTGWVNWYTNVGVSYLRRDQPEKAIDYLKQAIAENQNSQSAWINYGLALTKLGRYQESLEPYQKAAALPPFTNPDPLIALGGTLIRLRRFGEAKRVYEMVLERDPKNTEAHLQLGTFYLHHEDFDRAREHLSLARTDPEKRAAAEANLKELEARERRHVR